MRVGIIGGGAAGMIAAIASANNDNEVIIFERNQECGKKILMTGNGRCNYWNLDQSLFHYDSSTKDLIELLIDNDSSAIELFNSLGIIPKIKNGYYYPFSNQATTIRNVLLTELKKKNVKIKNNFLVVDVLKDNNNFIVVGEEENVIVDKLVIATGSKASPKSGSDGFGYELLKRLGHTIVKPLPALVQLKSKGDYLNIWNGVRTDCEVSLYENNQFIRKECGEIQLTNYGISGICVFNLSNRVTRGLDNNCIEDIYINFLPFIEKEYNVWFVEQTKLTDKSIYDLLKSILNEKIVEVVFKVSNISRKKKFTDLSLAEQRLIIDLTTNFKVNIVGSNSFNEAQVCSGGVLLSEINLETMESKLVNNLYIVGELLDITGDCGGYNLGIAWRTGIKAGKDISGGKYD